MGQWVKNFVDKTSFVGTDEDISKGIASWRNSRNNDITSVSIEDNGQFCVISGPFSEFWQSDTYEQNYMSKTPQIVVRRIQRQFVSKDILYKIDLNGCSLKLTAIQELPLKFDCECRPITRDMVGKWLTAEIHCKTKAIRFYISDGKI